ncbi:MAG: hypothetical protein ACI3ZC_07175 [Candidatus Cryptobacteroides sp.]
MIFRKELPCNARRGSILKSVWIGRKMCPEAGRIVLLNSDQGEGLCTIYRLLR